MDKVDEILAAADALRNAYGVAIALVDDWPSDRTALAVVRRGTEYPRVYFNSDVPVPGTFAVSLELSPEPGSELPYRDGGWLEDLATAGLLAAVAQHLRLPSPPG